jgi:hypothetical protein
MEVILAVSTRGPLFTKAKMRLCILHLHLSSTYDHRTLKIELPVRSAVLKQCTGVLVVRWVTTGEYPLLYVFAFLLPDFWLQNVRRTQCSRAVGMLQMLCNCR